MVEEARKASGPHANTAISIYMNKSAADAFAKSPAIYPVGAIVVKEKQDLGSTDDQGNRTAPADGVGGMIKRSKGYDPEHGDWEYFYLENGTKMESGRISSCVQCHSGVATKDYVFGGWARG